MAQVLLCAPTALRKAIGGMGTPGTGWALAGGIHFLVSGLAWMGNALYLAEKSRLEGVSDLVEWNDLSTIGKYGAIVFACNLASFTYEYCYRSYRLYNPKRPHGGDSLDSLY